MTPSATLWATVRLHVPKRQWVSTGEILSIIEMHSTFDDDDLRLQSSGLPQWKLNARRLLRQKAREGALRGRTGK